MFPQSIRWRLPLSYAGIALLATVALGGVLLTTLRGYYTNLEQRYLQQNADAFARIIMQMQADEVEESFLESSLVSFAFVSRTRIRLLDQDGALVGDSGELQDKENVRFAVRPQPVEAGNITSTGDFWVETGPFSEGPPPGQPFIAISTSDELPEGVYLVDVAASPFDARRNRREPIFDPNHRSGQQHTVSLQDSDGNLTGYLELSEGPAYGTHILSRVATGLVGAGTVAVLLAALVGWFMSRQLNQPLLLLMNATAQMSQGELSSRVDLDRRDEFGRLADSFNEMAGRVENTVIMLKQFVADAAHEIHTPITALQTNLELAAGEATDDNRVQYISRAGEQLARLEHLTNSLLDLARIESGNKDFQRSEVNLTPLLETFRDLYASRAEQADLEFESQIPPDAVNLSGNKHQLMQVLDNLLDNAFKFTPEKGKVSFGTTLQTDAVQIWITDTGIGIPAADHARLFHRFGRGRNVSAYPGNGLGLVISQTIVKQHGGNIEVKSDDIGTRVTVSLPLPNGGENGS